MARRNNDGCVDLILVLIFASVILFALGKGCVSCANDLLESSNNPSHTSPAPEENDSHTWGEDGVDPVLRTSTGGIFKDPNYPNYYFDITTTCPQCNGRGQWETIKPNTDIYDANGNLKTNVPIGKTEIVKCSACYGTGHQKRPIPADGKISPR